VKEKAGSNNVVFGDVNLAQAQGTGSKWHPGSGGWPTVRYFNRDTGYDGAPYKKKTDKSMCDELGDEKYMRAYVDEVSTPPCTVTGDSHSDCSEAEVTFIDSWRAKTGTDTTTELARLIKMQASAHTSMKAAQLTWLQQRIAILKQLAPAASGEGGDQAKDL